MGEPGRFGDRAMRRCDPARSRSSRRRSRAGPGSRRSSRSSARACGGSVQARRARTRHGVPAAGARSLRADLLRPALSRGAAPRRVARVSAGCSIATTRPTARWPSALAPEFLFCDLERLPAGGGSLWPGSVGLGDLRDPRCADGASLSRARRAFRRDHGGAALRRVRCERQTDRAGGKSEPRGGARLGRTRAGGAPS